MWPNAVLQVWRRNVITQTNSSHTSSPARQSTNSFRQQPDSYYSNFLRNTTFTDTLMRAGGLLGRIIHHEP